ncbi:hypothetical protein OH809_43365 [Streptomyces sp. NBC_00873]|uniref:hypothetical protein n=1 Tax=unclassified Streptomyces TaxID=2593676 RepID=UPI003865399C|nr:hypothetical protein OH809_00345 [Streptomyces sp. NBC_00873]WSY96865.1 hypothetical protein OH809_43365 [Streptomyces sp. NBC_00873]WTA41362.1 hypothetical protein OH821_00345 [Streptomyces sp. NBC_00842]WTA48535.1 hypothetical protein OH821_43470 [Streptomyces sp. NBC_00842]
MIGRSLAALAVAQVDQSPIGDQVPEKSVGPVEDVDKGACSTKVTKDLGQRITQVNAAGVRWSGATTDFVYRVGATSTLGVVVSLTGKAVTKNRVASPVLAASEHA